MKFVCISDCHGRFDWLQLPEGDILLVAGDIMNNYGGGEYKNALMQKMEFDGLVQLWNKLPFKKVICIAGNHDWLFEREDYRFYRNGKVIYLQGEEVEVGGFKIYGFPWQPRFYDWAFNVDRNSPKMAALLNKIPDDVEILISHGPPHGILDWSEYSSMHVGCEQMIRRVKELPNLKLHIFGHIHGAYGVVKKEMWGIHGQPVIFANASVCNEKYQAVNAPLVFEVEK